jgi:integrase
MPQKTQKRLPKLGRHSSGQARVTLNGKVHYLGLHGSLGAQKAYTDLIERWESNGRRPLEPSKTVVQLRKVRDITGDYLAYLTATGRYTKRGRRTSQRRLCELALEEFSQNYGQIPASELTDTIVVLHRDWVERRTHLTRTGVNRKMQHIRACFKWAAHRGMITRDQWLGIAGIESLTRAECGGRDWKQPKRPVTLEEVERVASAASLLVGRMLRVQAAIGCRPGEVVLMRWSDISTDNVVVDGVPCRVYTVEHAKNEHHNSAPTTYCMPPSVMKILGPPTGPGQYVFPSPKLLGSPYSRSAYCAATHNACKVAGVERFSPHCIRHGFLTRAANRYGVLAAAAAANHASTQVTAGYLHKSRDDGYRVVLGMLDGTTN